MGVDMTLYQAFKVITDEVVRLDFLHKDDEYVSRMLNELLLTTNQLKVFIANLKEKENENNGNGTQKCIRDS